jgi:hypothetical protein
MHLFITHHFIYEKFTLSLSVCLTGWLVSIIVLLNSFYLICLVAAHGIDSFRVDLCDVKGRLDLEPLS